MSFAFFSLLVGEACVLDVPDVDSPRDLMRSFEEFFLLKYLGGHWRISVDSKLLDNKLKEVSLVVGYSMAHLDALSLTHFTQKQLGVFLGMSTLFSRNPFPRA